MVSSGSTPSFSLTIGGATLYEYEKVQKSQEKDPPARRSAAKKWAETRQAETEARSSRESRRARWKSRQETGRCRERAERSQKSEEKTQPHTGTSRATGGDDESQMGCQTSRCHERAKQSIGSVSLRQQTLRRRSKQGQINNADMAGVEGDLRARC